MVLIPLTINWHVVFNCSTLLPNFLLCLSRKCPRYKKSTICQHNGKSLWFKALLHKTLSSEILNVSTDRDTTTSLVPISLKKSHIKSFVPICVHCPLSFHWAPLRRECMHLLPQVKYFETAVRSASFEDRTAPVLSWYVMHVPSPWSVSQLSTGLLQCVDVLLALWSARFDTVAQLRYN